MEIEKEDLYHELEIMRKIPHHPNVVDYLGCCTQQGRYHIWHHILLKHLNNDFCRYYNWFDQLILFNGCFTFELKIPFTLSWSTLLVETCSNTCGSLDLPSKPRTARSVFLPLPKISKVSPSRSLEGWNICLL